MGVLIDLTGQRFGKWTVIERDNEVNKKNIYWRCRCDCGTIRSVAGTSLRSGISTSCGCDRDRKTSLRTSSRVEDLAGNHYGMWTVVKRDISENGNSKRGARWICRCDCGTERSVLGYALRRGISTSCGCRNGEKKVIDLDGQRFGHLTVLRRDKDAPCGNRGAKWICQCDCGKIVSVFSGRLRSGQTKSCGCIRNKGAASYSEGLEGRRFGSWTVLQEVPSERSERTYLCRCDCGTTRNIPAYTLINGFSKSCGCQKSVPKEDLCGQRFGKLTVLGVDEAAHGHGIYWKCLCDCGNVKSYRSSILISGRAKSCGCDIRRRSSERLFTDLTGKRFGRLTVIAVDHKEYDDAGNSTYYWKCKCDCGNETIVQGTSLRNGDTKSCGCLQAEQSANRAKSRIIDIIGRRYGLLTVIERVEIDNGGFGLGKWKCLCDCGNYKIADGFLLRNGQVSSCGCLKQSKYELYVLQYFDEKGYISSVDYDYQKRFADLRGYGDGLLSYDFAFYNYNKLQLLIECQGQQHYEPIPIFGGEEQFAKQKLHDEMKRKYADKIGVPLIEIPYSADTYERVKRILVDAGL